MASRPPDLGDIVVEAPPEIAQREVIAYVPQIGQLTSRGGLDYDLAVSEDVTHANQHTRHPIEDPQRSFIYDHNREEPVTMNLELRVSANPLVAGSNGLRVAGVRRLTGFQDDILAMRAAQSVDTSAYFDVYTGLRIYRNMGIENITFRRPVEEPNVLEVSLSLVEFRFARPPRSESAVYLMDANDGPRNSANAELVEEIDRPIVETTRTRFAPRVADPTNQIRSVIRASIDKLDAVIKGRLDLDLGGVLTPEDIGVILPEDVPSQQYTVRIDGVDHDIKFEYNQLGDRWGFTLGATGADCARVAGRFVEPGFDLYAGLNTTQKLIPLDRPGISTDGLDWYARLTVPLSDGIPATMLVQGSTDAFGGLFYNREQVVC